MSGDMTLQRAAGRQIDEGAVHDVGQRQCSLPSQAVPLGQYQNERVVTKWKLLDRVGQSGRRGEPNVGRARRKGGGDIGALPLLDVEADRRIVSQIPGENLRQVLAQRGRVGEKPNTAR